MKAEIKKLEKSQVEIKVVIPSDKLMSYWDAAVKEIQKIAEVDGFRKGHVPEQMILSKFGDMAVLEEASQMAIGDAYPEILVTNKLDAIGYPEIRITKLAKDNDLEVTIVSSVLPEIKLPDYKKVAQSVAGSAVAVAVTDKEVDDTVAEIQKSRAHDAHHEANPDDHTHAHGDDLPLPELNDAFAQSIGDFKTLDELKLRVKENLHKEKESREHDKRRTAVMNAIAEATTIDMPEVLVDSEVDRMMAQIEADVAQFGGTMKDYLIHMKKSEEELRLEWRPEATRRSKVQMIMNEIAHAEKIAPTKEEIATQAEMVKEQYPEADVARIDGYVSQMLQNEKVLAFLEAK